MRTSLPQRYQRRDVLIPLVTFPVAVLLGWLQTPSRAITDYLDLSGQDTSSIFNSEFTSFFEDECTFCLPAGSGVLEEPYGENQEVLRQIEQYHEDRPSYLDSSSTNHQIGQQPTNEWGLAFPQSLQLTSRPSEANATNDHQTPISSFISPSNILIDSDGNSSDSIMNNASCNQSCLPISFTGNSADSAFETPPESTQKARRLSPFCSLH